MRERWSTPSVVLHWLSWAFILGLAAAGFIMTDLAADSGGRLLLSRMHTLGGATLMALTLARLVVRRRGGPVAPLPVEPLHRRGIGVIHGLLYVVVFLLGASGFAMGALSTWPNYLRGELAETPDLSALPPREGHEVLVFVLLALIGLHVGGVLFHEVRKGGALRRMLPFLK